MALSSQRKQFPLPKHNRNVCEDGSARPSHSIATLNSMAHCRSEEGTSPQPEGAACECRRQVEVPDRRISTYVNAMESIVDASPD
eukprot:326766-Pyramimonas_sp.AAC.1